MQMLWLKKVILLIEGQPTQELPFYHKYIENNKLLFIENNCFQNGQGVAEDGYSWTGKLLESWKAYSPTVSLYWREKDQSFNKD